MADVLDGRYWCHMCSQIVSPVMEAEIKCPYCDSGFVEEMDSAGGAGGDDGDSSVAAWAPVLLRMMTGSSSRRRRAGRFDLDGDDGDRDMETILRRWRRSAVLLQMLTALRDHTPSDSGAGHAEPELVRDTSALLSALNSGVAAGAAGSAGGGVMREFLLGPGLDLLLQHLAESEQGRSSGAPPAAKEAVEAMPVVKVSEPVSCPVCLEEIVAGEVAKEMPCKHRFHPGCIVPWLELHCSCPVCRFQVPSEASGEAKTPAVNNSNGNAGSSSGGSVVSTEQSGSNGGGGGRRFSLPWPFSGLFSQSSDSSSSRNGD